MTFQNKIYLISCLLLYGASCISNLVCNIKLNCLSKLWNIILKYLSKIDQKQHNIVAHVIYSCKGCFEFVFLNFDSICLSFWVITKTRRLVVWFHSPDYALILGCVSVVLLVSIQAHTCKAAMPGLQSLKENTHFRKLIFKTTARLFSIVEKLW